MPTTPSNAPASSSPSNSPTFAHFKSFVILDLETTNLPHLNYNKVAITELCLYGFSVSELEKRRVANLTGQIENLYNAKVPQTPRVLHRLNLMFNPRMMIHPDTEQLTGLSNYDLEYESSFDANAGNAVLAFLHHLQQPVCLVAHNGYGFDFPIFQAALKKIDMTLPAETLCLDSFRAFYDIDETPRVLLGTAAPSSNPSPEALSSIIDLTEDTPQKETDKEEEQTGKDVASPVELINLTEDSPATVSNIGEEQVERVQSATPEKLMKRGLSLVYVDSSEEEELVEPFCTSPQARRQDSGMSESHRALFANCTSEAATTAETPQKVVSKEGKHDGKTTDFCLLNETTPKRTSIAKAITPRKLHKRRSVPGDVDSEEELSSSSIDSRPKKQGSHTYKSRRALFSEFAASSPSGLSPVGKLKRFPPRGLYKLPNMYRRIFGEDVENSHSAESDVRALMLLILHCGEDFLAYAQARAVPFSEIPALGAKT